MKKKVLFISTNDGSDMRINKEIKTLSTVADVYFLGVGNYGEKNYAKELCYKFFLIEEKRNSPKAILKQINKYRELTKYNAFNSIHIINEQLMIFFYPWLFKEHAVLDIFDSLFMKKNKPGNKLKTLKRIIYKPMDFLLVTDKNRYALMPDFVKPKLGILENYPNMYNGGFKKETRELTIFYNGSMSNSRGTQIISNIIGMYKNVKVIMAGWIADKSTQLLADHIQVDFRGVMNQNEATKVAAFEADYIMCCYEPNNQNNINASPNKIFDAIQTHTPVIINKEVKVSSFVLENGLGVILDSFYHYDVDRLYQELVEKRDSFTFSKEQALKFSWESVEKKLLQAHKLIQD